MATVPHPTLPAAAASASEGRRVTPELLDSLAPDAPEAVRSRRDLRRLNALMGNFAWFERVLAARGAPGERILELGAGDGRLARRLATAGRSVAALDLAPPPAGWPQALPWHRTDLAQFDRWADYPVVIGNLIFHHFDGAALRRLGAQLDRHARLVLACEPQRSARAHVLFSAACALIGADAVTRHDGRVSIAAGFRGDELADALGLRPSRWHWCADTTFRGASRLIAVRKSPP